MCEPKNSEFSALQIAVHRDRNDLVPRILIPFYEQVVWNLVSRAEALQCLSVRDTLDLVADVEPLKIFA